MSSEKREYVYQVALFVLFVALIVLASYKLTSSPSSRITDELEEALQQCVKCEDLVERINPSLYNPDFFEPMSGEDYDKYVDDLDSIASLLDVKLKLLKVNIIESLALLHRASAHISQ